jgi:hypothetical protein
MSLNLKILFFGFMLLMIISMMDALVSSNLIDLANRIL